MPTTSMLESSSRFARLPNIPHELREGISARAFAGWSFDANCLASCAAQPSEKKIDWADGRRAGYWVDLPRDQLIVLDLLVGANEKPSLQSVKRTRPINVER